MLIHSSVLLTKRSGPRRQLARILLVGVAHQLSSGPFSDYRVHSSHNRISYAYIPRHSVQASRIASPRLTHSSKTKRVRPRFAQKPPSPVQWRAFSRCFPRRLAEPPRRSAASSSFQLSREKARYVEHIAQFLPDKVDVDRKPSLQERRRDYVKWVPPSAKEQGQAELNPFGNWRTALGLLKKYYHPRNGQDTLQGGRGWRKVLYVPVRDHLKKTINVPKKPGIWSENSFTAYIQDLVHFQAPGGTLHDVLPDEAKKRSLQTNFDQINEIERLFKDRDVRNFVTVEAGNIALQYFYDKQRMRQARALYLRMESLFVDLPTSTWNIILRASAAYKDLHNFSFLLHKMIERGFRPDEEAWISLVMVLDSLDARRGVIAEMSMLGITEQPKVRRELANQMCLIEFQRSESKNTGAGPFFAMMSARYGRDWLSPSTGNIILSEVLRPTSGPRIAALVRALVLLHAMKQYAFAANSVTMDLLLKATADIGRGDLVVDILQIFRSHWGLEPDRQAHWRLFHYGWQRQKLNFLRIVWISACLNGFTSSYMRYRVTQSLSASKQSISAKDPSDVFRKSLGWFLVSLDPQRSFAGFSESEKGGYLDDQNYLALKSSLGTIGQGSLKHGIVPILKQALIIDREWESQKRQASSAGHDNQSPDLKLDIVRTADNAFINEGSSAKLSRRLRWRNAQSLRRSANLRHKRDTLGPLRDLKFEQLASMSRKKTSNLTFRMMKPSPRRSKQFSKTSEPRKVLANPRRRAGRTFRTRSLRSKGRRP